jgi:ferredoxin, 2Fe-2S
MPKVVFIEPAGTRREIQAPAGISLMQAALQNKVEGIIALCGGACACATCQVYIDPAWLAKLGAREDMEEGMLEAAFEPKANSRLSCQITLTPALDGLIAVIPAQQGD